MAFVVVYDACVLYPAPLRDLLLRLAETGAFRARWSDEILNEVFRSLARDRPDLDRKKLDRTRALMNRAIPDATVRCYEELVEGLSLPDPDDRHVLAAAIHAGAQVIVTLNIVDFPAEALAAYGLEAQTPDDFVLDVIDLNPVAVVDVVRAQQASLRSPPMTMSALFDRFVVSGLPKTVEALRAYVE